MTIQESSTDIPYLGAEQVVEEVITLLAKLENDRQQSVTHYKAQREKVKKLSARIDALAERRLDMLPAAVQNGAYIIRPTCAVLRIYLLISLTMVLI